MEIDDLDPAASTIGGRRSESQADLSRHMSFVGVRRSNRFQRRTSGGSDRDVRAPRLRASDSGSHGRHRADGGVHEYPSSVAGRLRALPAQGGVSRPTQEPVDDGSAA